MNEKLPLYRRQIEPRLDAYKNWRRDLHKIPELGFQEHKTSAYVRQRLSELGVDFVSDLAGTGVVAWVQRGNADRAIGLRTELDGLPITEVNELAYKSTHEGQMHACGHDGHMAMLLAACEQIKLHAEFDGTVYFIFQPAEEGGGGAKVMVEQGLFERFNMQSVYGLHNFPGLDTGKLAAIGGAVMASVDEFYLSITGRGGHAARPHVNIDPIVCGSQVVSALQSIVSRNINPNDPVVVSVTQFHAGTASNIIPESARIVGTVRCFSEAARDTCQQAIKRIISGVCTALATEHELEYKRLYPVTINHDSSSATCSQLAGQLLGANNVYRNCEPSLGGEDFAYMLQAKPGCYAKIGNGASADLHSCHYDFNDDNLLPGVAYWRYLAESLLPPAA